jgi:hypothetical protein
MRLFSKQKPKALQYPWLKPKDSLIPNQLAHENGTLFLVVPPGTEQPTDLIVNPLDGRFYASPDKSVKLPRIREIKTLPADGCVLQLTDTATAKTVYMHSRDYTFEKADRPLTDHSMPHFNVVQGEIAGISSKNAPAQEIQ